eukprot:m.70252 g.70252  ORF g.70252 m.70252 type:complete len:71 (+) comp13767_c0_seq5:396-608(+)
MGDIAMDNHFLPHICQRNPAEIEDLDGDLLLRVLMVCQLHLPESAFTERLGEDIVSAVRGGDGKASERHR